MERSLTTLRRFAKPTYVLPSPVSVTHITPPPQQQGLLVLLIPRSSAVSTKPVKTSYSATAGTAYVTFDSARVPVSHMLGKVGQGLQVILSNFNHERWMVAATSLGAQRLIVEECLK
jgi:alkylation response protein AidB-like acyl-CoA dehydrogenase